MDLERDAFLQKIKETQEQYYEKHKKNTVFKNNQKLDCAKHVSSNVDLQKMIHYTAVIVPNTNIIYYNYMIFKTYGNEETHIPLYTHVTGLIEILLQTYQTFEFHINMKTFSISACQRYQKMIMSSFDHNKIFTERMTKLVVYHTPNIIPQITNILYSSVKDILYKVEYVKEDSEKRIAALFQL